MEILSEEIANLRICFLSTSKAHSDELQVKPAWVGVRVGTCEESPNRPPQTTKKDYKQRVQDLETRVDQLSGQEFPIVSSRPKGEVTRKNLSPFASRQSNLCLNRILRKWSARVLIASL